VTPPARDRALVSAAPGIPRLGNRSGRTRESGQESHAVLGRHPGTSQPPHLPVPSGSRWAATYHPQVLSAFRWASSLAATRAATPAISPGTRRPSVDRERHRSLGAEWKLADPELRCSIFRSLPPAPRLHPPHLMTVFRSTPSRQVGRMLGATDNGTSAQPADGLNLHRHRTASPRPLRSPGRRDRRANLDARPTPRDAFGSGPLTATTSPTSRRVSSPILGRTLGLLRQRLRRTRGTGTNERAVPGCRSGGYHSPPHGRLLLPRSVAFHGWQ